MEFSDLDNMDEIVTIMIRSKNWDEGLWVEYINSTEYRGIDFYPSWLISQGYKTLGRMINSLLQEEG